MNDEAVRAAQHERRKILDRIQISRAELERRWEHDEVSEEERMVLARLRELDWAPE